MTGRALQLCRSAALQLCRSVALQRRSGSTRSKTASGHFLDQTIDLLSFRDLGRSICGLSEPRAPPAKDAAQRARPSGARSIRWSPAPRPDGRPAPRASSCCGKTGAASPDRTVP